MVFTSFCGACFGFFWFFGFPTGFGFSGNVLYDMYLLSPLPYDMYLAMVMGGLLILYISLDPATIEHGTWNP